MKHSLVLTFLLAGAVVGRENPFFSADPSQIQKVTSNVPDTKPPLGTVRYTPPNQSRILQEASFTFQNIDGSIETQKIQVDRQIDWHKSINITQGSEANPEQSSSEKGASSADFGFVKIATLGKRMSITASAAVARHFPLSDPNRIVIDFKDDREFKLLEKRLDAAPYLSVSVGSHGKFIRMSVTMDGRYRYAFKQNGNIVSIVTK